MSSSSVTTSVSSFGVVYPDPSSSELADDSSSQHSSNTDALPRVDARDNLGTIFERSVPPTLKANADGDLAETFATLSVNSDPQDPIEGPKVEGQRNLSMLLSNSVSRSVSRSEPTASTLSLSTGRVPSARKNPKSAPTSNSVDTSTSPRAEAQITVQRYENNNFKDIGPIAIMDSKIRIALYNRVCDICGQKNTSVAAAAATSEKSEKVQNAENVRDTIENFWKTSREKKLVDKIHNEPEFRSKLTRLSYCLLPSQELFSILEQFIKDNGKENIIPVQSIMSFIVEWIQYFKNTTELSRVTPQINEILRLSEDNNFLKEIHDSIEKEILELTGTPFTDNKIPTVEKGDLTEAKLRTLQEKSNKLNPQELFSLYHFEETDLILARSIILHKTIIKAVKDHYSRLKETETVKKLGIPRTIRPRQDFIKEIYTLEKTCLKNHDYASSYALLAALKELEPQKDLEKLREAIIFAQDKTVPKAKPILSILLLHEKIHTLKKQLPEYCEENDFNYERLETFVELFSRLQ